MKKRQMIRKITIGCYIALLLLPYCYGTALPQKGLNSPHDVYGFVVPSSGQMTFNTSCIHLTELIKQGDQYHDHHQYFQSIEIYKEVLQNYTQKTLLLAQLYNNMGMSYLALKDYRQTGLCYDKALTIREQIFSMVKSFNDKGMKQTISEAMGKSHHNLGILYLELKQHTEAILSFDASLKTQWQYHTEAIDTQFYLARTYQQVKRYQASKKLYEAILEKQAKISYLQPATVASIEKYLNQVTEKIAHIDEITLFNSPTAGHHHAMTLHQPQLAQKSLPPSSLEVNKAAQKETHPS
ncbi:MAG: tetratricopeptide repeat protein, partial [Bacteroidota bacterium]